MFEDKAPSVFNVEDAANSVTSEQFELFLRAYARRHIERLASNPLIVMFVIATPYSGAPTVAKAHWSIGTGSTQTNGELLAACIDEANRRVAFEQSNKLMLIEHEPTVPEALPEALPGGA